MNTINKKQVVNKIIERNGDKFMTVTFRKLDGTMRTLNGRTGVWSHTTGGKDGSPRNTENLCTVWSPKSGYRCFRLESVQSIKSRNFNYNVAIFDD